LIEAGASLPQQLLRGLQALIPHEFGGCHWIYPARQEISPHYEPERPPVPSQHRDFWRLREAHPLNSLLFAQPAKAWKLSDVISHRAFLTTECYNALYRPLQVDRELVAVLPEQDKPGAFLALSLHRHGADFTERDRALLNLLLPHVAKVWRRLAGPRRLGTDGRLVWSEESGFCEWLRSHTAWRLTPRESQVLYWLCQGKTNGEIGSILGIAERTAETHALRLYPKMGVENRYTAIAMLNRMAVLDDPQPAAASWNQDEALCH
jgi:DNA-binding CsgD family transcriptional regulator